MPSGFELNDLETDLLAELFNIGVGKAADSLSRMVKQEVKLSVPSVEFRTVDDMAEFLGGGNTICSVSQTMKGTFDARSMLLFPEENGMEVVRQLMGSQLSDELVAEMQEEALSEIGNIVLNACIGAIATSLEGKFEVDLPIFEKGTPLFLLASTVSGDDDGVLSIKIHMDLSQCKVRGYLAFLLGPSSQQNLQKCLKIMLDRISG